MQGEGAENDSTKMSEVYGPLIVAAGYGLDVVAVAHTVKFFDMKKDHDTEASFIRGSSAVISNSSIIAMLKKPKDANVRATRRFLKVVRNRYERQEDYPAFYTELDPDGSLRRVTDAQTGLSIMAAIDQARHRNHRCRPGTGPGQGQAHLEAGCPGGHRRQQAGPVPQDGCPPAGGQAHCHDKGLGARPKSMTVPLPKGRV
jgi:hypothetical protein